MRFMPSNALTRISVRPSWYSEEIVDASKVNLRSPGPLIVSATDWVSPNFSSFIQPSLDARTPWLVVEPPPRLHVPRPFIFGDYPNNGGSFSYLYTSNAGWTGGFQNLNGGTDIGWTTSGLVAPIYNLTLGYNASWSHPLYGASNTNQPSAIRVLSLVKAY